MINNMSTFKNAPFGYVLHEKGINNSGDIAEYRFLEVNDAFERIFGLKKENIIGKTVKSVSIEYNDRKFNWIDFFSKLALDNSEDIYVQQLEHKVKYYRVYAYSPDKNYFITIFTDISDKLQENENLLRLINNANLGTWEWNIETGETIFNEQWAAIIGYTLEELSPISIDTWNKYTHPDDLQKSNNEMNAHFLRENDKYQCEVRMRHKNGDWIWVQDTGKVTLWTDDGKPKIMSGVHQEITKRKQVELKLYNKFIIERHWSEISSEFIHTNDIDATIISSFAKLGEITNSSRVYLFLIDKDKATMSNTHEWCNKGVTEEKDNLQNLPLSIFPWWMKKLDNNEIIDINDVSMMPIEAQVEKEILESQNIRSVMALPVYAVNQLIGFVGFDNVSSNEIWSERENKYLNLLADTISNAIVRKVNEEELRLLAKSVEISPIPVMITDFQGIICYVNPVFETTTGYNSSEALGKTPAILNSGIQSKSIYTELWNTILSGNTWQGELQNKTKNGKIYWANESIYPIKHNNNITHFVSLIQDISEKRKLIDELIEAKFKAEESDRLKSAFLATMNHELRTPLNHVIGFSSLIPDMTDDNSIKEFSELIHYSGLNLLKIIENIFELAMLEKSDVNIRIDEIFIRDIYIDLKKQIQDILSESKKGDNIQLEFKLDSSIVTKKIITDKSKVKQVMSNIIKNAVKFTDKGTISLTVIQEKDNTLSIKVKDTGIGIPKDKQGIIFDFFRQVDDSHTRNYEGVGIGLAISQKIAQIMDGSITVVSEPEKGSEFTFSFPFNLYMDEKIDNKQDNNRFVVPDFSNKKVLIVEDDLIGTGMIINMLMPSKCKIINVVNGKEAIDIFKVHPDIDIILMDLKMPIMDGFEATKAIRKQYSYLPIIALTAYTLHADKNKAINSGCNDILTKPINKETMYKKMQELLVVN